MDLLTEVEQRLAKAFPNEEIKIDFADGKHMEVIVKAKIFTGLSLIDQHKMVYAAVDDLIKQGYLHALKIKTLAK